MNITSLELVAGRFADGPRPDALMEIGFKKCFREGMCANFVSDPKPQFRKNEM